MDSATMDRAAGVLLGQACGDALGAAYEFGPSLPDEFEPQMVGGGPFGFAPGEFTDDTAMAVCIAQVAATGADLNSDAALDDIAEAFMTWAQTAKDVGNQTRAVLSAARSRVGRPGVRAAEAAAAHTSRYPNAEGNGSLMRTAVIGLSPTNDRFETADAAARVSALTHAGPLAVDGCVLWTEAVRVAVEEGRLDLLGGLDLIDPLRRDQWRHWIDEATRVDPRMFARNGFVVWALQAAWAAVTWTPIPATSLDAGAHAVDHFASALKNAVRAGGDADTIAAIAGSLLGARWGQSGILHGWQRQVHGNGGLRAHGLVSLAVLAATRGVSDTRGWPQVSRMDYGPAVELVGVLHPHDDGVVLGSFSTLKDHGCDAVVSLCRIGEGDRADAGDLGKDHVEIRLLDSEYAEDNPHLAFAIGDAASAIRSLRREGKGVFVHCVMAQQRTPAVAVAYARLLGIKSGEAQSSVLSALPSASGHGRLWDAATR